jgi:hypothetical protein
MVFDGVDDAIELVSTNAAMRVRIAGRRRRAGADDEQKCAGKSAARSAAEMAEKPAEEIAGEIACEVAD